jgi:hypothetical protein
MQRDNGVTKNTKDKEIRVWKRWQEYAKLIDYEHDIWLETVAKLGEIFRANVGYNPTHGNGTDGFHPALAR